MTALRPDAKVSEERLSAGPCPFCGCACTIIETVEPKDPEPIYHAECWRCGARGPVEDSSDKALESWNRRIISAPPACSLCDAAKIEAHDWRVKYKNLRDSWKLVGETLRELDYNPGSEDRWVSKVYGALVDFDRLKRRVRNYTGTLEELVEGLHEALPPEENERP